MLCYDTNTFKSDSTITRAEAVAVVNRARGTLKRTEKLTNDLFVLLLDLDSSHLAFADIAGAAAFYAEYGSSWLYPAEDPILAIKETIGKKAYVNHKTEVHCLKCS